MPNSYIQKLAKSGKGTLRDLEKKWKKAVEIAKSDGEADNYAYITGIFKKMIKEKKTMKTYAEFINESASGKRVLIRSLKRQLSSDWSFGGVNTLVAMADEDKASIEDAVKALETISGVGKFEKAKLAGGMKASYDGGIISVVVSGGKVRIEYA